MATLFRTYYHLILLLLFTSGTLPALGAQEANSSPTRLCQEAISANLRPSQVIYPVSQCRGSCYFEASHSQFTNLVSLMLGTQMTLSRVYAIGHFLEKAGSSFIRQLENTTYLAINDVDMVIKENLDRKQIRKLRQVVFKEGRVDIFSGGFTGIYLEVLRQNGYVLQPKTSQLQVHQENKMIEFMVTEVEKKLWSFKEKLQQTQNNSERNQLRKSAESDLKIFVLTLVSKHLAGLNNLGFHQLPPNTKIHTSTLNLKSHFTASSPDSNSSVNFSPKLQSLLKKKLDAGQEILLSYFHVKKLTANQGNEQGLIDVPPNHETIPSTSFRKGEAGDHLASIVQYVEDKTNGNIKYLILRNTWGYSGLTYSGYHLITPNYLYHYGKSIRQIHID